MLTLAQSNSFQPEEGTRGRGCVVGPGEKWEKPFTTACAEHRWCWCKKSLGWAAPAPCHPWSTILLATPSNPLAKPSLLLVKSPQKDCAFYLPLLSGETQAAGALPGKLSIPPIQGGTWIWYFSKHSPETVFGLAVSDWVLAAQSQQHFHPWLISFEVTVISWRKVTEIQKRILTTCASVSSTNNFNTILFLIFLPPVKKQQKPGNMV